MPINQDEIMRTALAIPLIDDSRGRRVAELLIVVCILSLADLIFTVWAHVVTPADFIEVNPLARTSWGIGIFGLVVMKLALTAWASASFGACGDISAPKRRCGCWRWFM